MNYPINRAITHWPGNDDVFVVVRHYGYLRDFTKIDAAKYRSIDKIFEEEITLNLSRESSRLILIVFQVTRVVAHFFYIDQVLLPFVVSKENLRSKNERWRRTNHGESRVE